MIWRRILALFTKAEEDAVESGRAVAYPARIEARDGGGYIVAFRDLPGATRRGADIAEAPAAAARCLEAALARYLAKRDLLPPPTRPLKYEEMVLCAGPIGRKAAVVQAMRAAGLNRILLANRLGVPKAAIDRMLDPERMADPERLDAAVKACREG